MLAVLAEGHSRTNYCTSQNTPTVDREGFQVAPTARTVYTWIREYHFGI